VCRFSVQFHFVYILTVFRITTSHVARIQLRFSRKFSKCFLIFKQRLCPYYDRRFMIVSIDDDAVNLMLPPDTELIARFSCRCYVTL